MKRTGTVLRTVEISYRRSMVEDTAKRVVATHMLSSQSVHAAKEKRIKSAEKQFCL